MTDDEKVENIVPSKLNQKWVALLQLSTKDDVDRAAAGYFGPGKNGSQFKAEFGIDMNEFRGHYLEVDLAEAPVGPFIRGRVRPIIGIRQVDDGFRPHIFSYPNGFINERSGMAWIPAEDWKKLVG